MSVITLTINGREVSAPTGVCPINEVPLLKLAEELPRRIKEAAKP